MAASSSTSSFSDHVNRLKSLMDTRPINPKEMEAWAANVRAILVLLPHGITQHNIPIIIDIFDAYIFLLNKKMITRKEIPFESLYSRLFEFENPECLFQVAIRLNEVMGVEVSFHLCQRAYVMRHTEVSAEMRETDPMLNQYKEAYLKMLHGMGDFYTAKKQFEFAEEEYYSKVLELGGKLRFETCLMLSKNKNTKNIELALSENVTTTYEELHEKSIFMRWVAPTEEVVEDIGDYQRFITNCICALVFVHYSKIKKVSDKIIDLSESELSRLAEKILLALKQLANQITPQHYKNFYHSESWSEHKSYIQAAIRLFEDPNRLKWLQKILADFKGNITYTFMQHIFSRRFQLLAHQEESWVYMKSDWEGLWTHSNYYYDQYSTLSQETINYRERELGGFKYLDVSNHFDSILNKLRWELINHLVNTELPFDSLQQYMCGVLYHHQAEFNEYNISVTKENAKLINAIIFQYVLEMHIGGKTIEPNVSRIISNADASLKKIYGLTASKQVELSALEELAKKMETPHWNPSECALNMIYWVFANRHSPTPNVSHLLMVLNKLYNKLADSHHNADVVLILWLTLKPIILQAMKTDKTVLALYQKYGEVFYLGTARKDGEWNYAHLKKYYTSFEEEEKNTSCTPTSCEPSAPPTAPEPFVVATVSTSAATTAPSAPPTNPDAITPSAVYKPALTIMTFDDDVPPPPYPVQDIEAKEASTPVDSESKVEKVIPASNLFNPVQRQCLVSLHENLFGGKTSTQSQHQGLISPEETSLESTMRTISTFATQHPTLHFQRIISGLVYHENLSVSLKASILCLEQSFDMDTPEAFLQTSIDLLAHMQELIAFYQDNQEAILTCTTKIIEFLESEGVQALEQSVNPNAGTQHTQSYGIRLRETTDKWVAFFLNPNKSLSADELKAAGKNAFVPGKTIKNGLT